MAQVLKQEIKEKILASALKVFADKGYEKCSIADIANSAGLSAGNIYRYFPNKEALFYAALPEELSRVLIDTAKKNINLWNGKLISNDPGHFEQAHNQLINVMIENREQLIILFRHSKGTIYENLAEEMSECFLMCFMNYLESIGLTWKTNQKQFVIVTKQIYRNLIAIFADLLASDNNIEVIRSSLLLYLEYHIAGIRHLCE